MRELVFVRSGRLRWREREPLALGSPTDAIVRPLVAGRCDGDTLPLHRPVSRALQIGIAARLVDPVVGCICGRLPFAGPFPIGHECVAEVIAIGDRVRSIRTGQRVVVPWAVSCGPAVRIECASLAEAIRLLDGTQPVNRQSPPGCSACSTSTTRPPTRAATVDAINPAAPPPSTTRS